MVERPWRSPVATEYLEFSMTSIVFIWARREVIINHVDLDDIFVHFKSDDRTRIVVFRVVATSNVDTNISQTHISGEHGLIFEVKLTVFIILFFGDLFTICCHEHFFLKNPLRTFGYFVHLSGFTLGRSSMCFDFL